MSRTAICAALGIALAVFVSHKVVQAAPIVASDAAAHTLTIMLPSGEQHTLTPSPGFFARAVPTPGDYFVVYEGGYQSHSPKDIFEDGYKVAAPAIDLSNPPWVATIEPTILDPTKADYFPIEIMKDGKDVFRMDASGAISADEEAIRKMALGEDLRDMTTIFARVLVWAMDRNASA